MEVVITGTSSGIGKGLAEYYLAQGKTVHGISRSCTIDHPAYVHHFADLSKPDFLTKLSFKSDADYLLINNAGVLGKVARLSEQRETDIEAVFSVNLFAAVRLMKYFSGLTPCNLLIVVNISSGAGRNPIPSWLSYCSSKAALDMASRVFQLEQLESGRNTRVYSVAPGVVDTPMQSRIRSVDAADFSAIDTFRQYKEAGQLVSPGELGQKLDTLLSMPYSGQVLFSLRDF